MSDNEDRGSEATLLNEGEKTIALAATMIEVLGRAHDLSDADMNEACARALAINMSAAGGDQEAAALVLDAGDRLRAVWRGVHAARVAKTIN